VPLTDGVACADKWLSLSDPGQLFVVGAAMRSRGEPSLADELERKRANTGGARIGRLFLNTRLLAIYRGARIEKCCSQVGQVFTQANREFAKYGNEIDSFVIVGE
jgi:hypothetical protein